MYYAEEVINGVLCFKTMPGADWQQFTKEQLTERLVKAEQQRDTLFDRLTAEG